MGVGEGRTNHEGTCSLNEQHGNRCVMPNTGIESCRNIVILNNVLLKSTNTQWSSTSDAMVLW